MRYGRTGSTDRFILDLDRHGLYLSVRWGRGRRTDEEGYGRIIGLRLAFGPRYKTTLEARR